MVIVWSRLDVDCGMFSVFDRRIKGAPQAIEYRPTVQHFLAYGASSWRVATFKSLFGAA